MKRPFLLIVLFIAFCSPKFQPDKFSFPLQEVERVELKGAPIFFDGKTCLTDEGWKAELKERGKFKIYRSAQRTSSPVKKGFSSILVEGEDQYYGTQDGYVIRKSRGKVKWKRKIGGGVVARPASWKNFLFVASLDGHLYAFKKKTGALLWIKKLPGRGKYPPLVLDEVVVAPSLSEKIKGFHLNGRPAGDYKLEGVLKFPVSVVEGKRLVAVSYDWERQTTVIQILARKLGVEIKIFPSPPVSTAEGAEIKAKIYGFYSPEVIFKVNGKVLSKGEDTKVLWFPSQEGIYKVEVMVREGGVERSQYVVVEVKDPKKERLRMIMRERSSCYWKK